MGDALELKLLMQNSNPSNTMTSVSPKAYKCETCNTTYSDKMYYELHKQGHQKDIPVVQIVNFNSGQIIPQPAHQPQPTQQILQQPQHQPQQPQQQSQTPMQATPIIIPEDQLASYKKIYGADSQIYAITPFTQYQVINANNRVTMSQSQPGGHILQSYTPAYVLTGTDGQQQIHAIQEQALEIPSQMHPQTINLQQQVQAPQMQQTHQQTIHQQATMNQPQQQQTSTPVQRGSKSIITPSKNRPYKCDQCTASFIEPNELEEHRKKHTGDGPFTCEDCHFTFMYKSHFKSHKTRCQKKRAMMPQTQKTIIMQPPSFKREFPTNPVVNHTTKTSFKKEFSTTQVVNNSTKQFNSDSPLLQKYSSGSAVKVTSRTMNKQVYKSQAKFNPNNPSFKRIKREKRIDRPFECDECDASFQTDLDLKTHKSKHTGEGPFKCEECRFVFLYRKLYEAHRRRCEKKRKGALLHAPGQIIGGSGMISNSQEVLTSSAISTQSSVISQFPQSAVIQQPELQQQQHPSQSTQMQMDAQHSGAISSEANVAFAAPISMHSNLSQNSIIEMQAVGQHGEIQRIQVPHNTVIEQVIVNSEAGSSASGERQDIKYDIIPVSVGAVDDGTINVSQIMNLIKVKENDQ